MYYPDWIIVQERGLTQHLYGFSRKNVADHIRKPRRWGLKVASISQITHARS